MHTRRESPQEFCVSHPSIQYHVLLLNHSPEFTVLFEGVDGPTFTEKNKSEQKEYLEDLKEELERLQTVINHEWPLTHDGRKSHS